GTLLLGRMRARFGRACVFRTAPRGRRRKTAGASGGGRMRLGRKIVGWAKRRARAFRVGKIVCALCPRGEETADDFAHPTGYDFMIRSNAHAAQDARRA